VSYFYKLKRLNIQSKGAITMKYFGMYKEAKDEYLNRLGEIRADENLSATGRENECNKAFAKYQAAVNAIAEDYNQAMAENAHSLKAHKEKILANVLKPDPEEIALEDYLFRGFVSKMALVNTDKEFFDQVIEMAEGNEMQRRALMTNFSSLLKLGEDFVTKSFEKSQELSIWKAKSTPGTETKATDADLKITAISDMVSRLKEVYTKTRESLKTEQDLKHEARVKALEDKMSEMNGEVFAIQRLFKQDTPSAKMPIFKTPGQEWADIVNSVNG
jgi:hypothetical protein